jgi:signal transduction histidine kinase
VVKHAEATRVRVQVAERDGTVEVVVSDDGRGFTADGTTEGFGLIGMRERIRLAGGQHDMRSEPGRGTTVRALIPATRVEGTGPARAQGG